MILVESLVKAVHILTELDPPTANDQTRLNADRTNFSSSRQWVFFSKNWDWQVGCWFSSQIRLTRINRSICFFQRDVVDPARFGIFSGRSRLNSVRSYWKLLRIWRDFIEFQSFFHIFLTRFLSFSRSSTPTNLLHICWHFNPLDPVIFFSW